MSNRDQYYDDQLGAVRDAVQYDIDTAAEITTNMLIAAGDDAWDGMREAIDRANGRG